MLPGVDYCGSVDPRPGKSEQRYCRDLVHLESERGDYAEVATTTATQCPEEIGIVVRITGEHTPIGHNHLSREQIVTGQAKLTAQDAIPASKCQTGDTHSLARASKE